MLSQTPYESVEQILSELQIYFQDTEDENYIARISDRISAAQERAIGRHILTVGKDVQIRPVFSDNNQDVFILRDNTGVPIQLDYNGKTYDIIENTLLTKKDK